MAAALDAAATQVIQAIRGRKGKAVVLVLDVSASMTNGRRLHYSVAALQRIVRVGTQVGDTVAVFSFDASPTLVLKPTHIGKESDKQIVVDRIPTVSNNTVGSNIRWAHHEALKLLAGRDDPYQVCILVSDNQHDAPPEDDPSYADYLKYYVPGTLAHPDTAESRDYARLRDRFTGVRHVTYGIGVDVSIVGQVRELPPPKRTPAWIYAAWAAAAVLLLGVVWAAVFAVRRAAAARKSVQSPITVHLRDVSPGAKGPAFRGDKAVDLGPQDSFELGGPPFASGKVVPLPGVPTREPLARVRRDGPRFTIEALVPRDRAVVQVDGVDVVQGQPARPIRLGQTIALRVPMVGGLDKQVHLLFTDAASAQEAHQAEEVVLNPDDASPY